MNDEEFRSVVARIPEIAQATDLAISLLPGGLSNLSYLVDADGAQFVVRIVGENGSILVSDRAREEAALRRAVEAGMAPEVVLFIQPEGHLVTRFLRDARPLTVDEFSAPEMIPRLASKMRDVHALGGIEGSFDPYDDIRRWLDVVDARGTSRPARLTPLLGRVAETERERLDVRASETVLCHNDPFHLNFLDDGFLWLIDWEYTGMGDPMYDLASIGYTLDRVGRDMLLESYFGSLKPEAQRDLDAQIEAVLCWNVVWSLIQMNGGVQGFDYFDFAEELLDSASHE